MKWRASVLCPAVCILFVLAGCGKGDDWVEQAVLYMDERYDDHFEVLKTGTQSWQDAYTECLMRSKRFPEAHIVVRIWDEAATVTDNYPAFLHEARYCADMQQMADRVFDKCVVFNYPSGVPFRLDGDAMSYEAYTAGEDVRLDSVIFTKSDVRKREAEEKLFMDCCRAWPHRQRVTICYLREDCPLPQTKAEAQAYLLSRGENIVLRGDLWMDEKAQIIEERWRSP